MRPTKEETFMKLAILWSKLSTCSTRASVGCVIVDNVGHVIASGYNGSPRGFPHCDEVGCDLDENGHCIRAIHAETNAILQCATTGTICNGATLYVTHIPCERCQMVIIQAGIKKVVYNIDYRGALAKAKQNFNFAGIELEHLDVHWS